MIGLDAPKTLVIKNKGFRKKQHFVCFTLPDRIGVPSGVKILWLLVKVNHRQKVVLHSDNHGPNPLD